MQRHRRRLFTVITALAVGALGAGCPARMSDVEKHTKDGSDYFAKGSYAKAEAAFDRAVELEPDQPGLLVNRGNARMMLDRHGEARADYDAAIAVDPGFAMAYANRGILRDRTGDAEGAIADYRRALELDPELGEGPSVWQLIIGNPSTDTISGRLHYLEAVQRGEPTAPPSEAEAR